MTAPQILLLTHSQDFFTIDRVHQALATRGVSALRLNTDALPWSASLSWTSEGDGGLVVSTPEGVHDLSQVKAVWARRLWPGQQVPEGTPADEAAEAANQATGALHALESYLSDVPWLNLPGPDLAASEKATQLKVAKQVGLVVPPTLISSDAAAIRAFAARQRRVIIGKALRPGPQSMQGRCTDHTQVLGAEELEALPTPLTTTRIYQPLIAKAYELRVVLVGDDLWAGSIDASESADGQVDWRASDTHQVSWQIGDVPDDVAERLFALRDRLGLAFGVVDLIVTPEGEHVFLEINPAGEWGMLERDLDLPISRSIARWLMTQAGLTQRRADGGVQQVTALPEAPRRRPLPISAPQVLLVSMSNDNESVQMVAEALRQRGARPIRLDTDRYPTELGIGSRLDSGIHRTLTLRGGEVIEANALAAAWNRRYRAGGRLPMTQLGDTGPACMGETRRALQGFLGALDCFRLDPYESVRRADHKELQLRRAAELGLRTPNTLITNHPDEVRAFYEANDGKIVTKMQHSFAIYREGEEQVVFTNPVSRDDLSRLDGLRYCPMTFQSNIAKRLELRATVIGTRVFTAAVDSQRSEAATTDWRRDGSSLEYAWTPHDLPADIAGKLVRLVGEFGLNYSAADFILTPEGEYVFLEINAAGEFFWLQHAPGLPLVEQIADVLLGQAERNPLAAVHGGGVPGL